MSDLAGGVTIVAVITALVLAVGWVLIKMDEAAGPRQPKGPDGLGAFGWTLLILVCIACPPMILIGLVLVAKAKTPRI